MEGHYIRRIVRHNILNIFAYYWFPTLRQTLHVTAGIYRIRMHSSRLFTVELQ